MYSRKDLLEVVRQAHSFFVSNGVHNAGHGQTLSFNSTDCINLLNLLDNALENNKDEPLPKDLDTNE